jgi:hypothetical protein
MGNTVIQLRNDTASNWTTNNPTLAQGEMGLETDTNKIKFGDGSTAWNSLPYIGAGSSFKYGLYTLSADQTSHLAVNDHIEWNTSAGSLGGLSTGSGQANGIVTLAGGKTYKAMFDLGLHESALSQTMFQIYNRTSSSYLGKLLWREPLNVNASVSQNGIGITIFTTTEETQVEVRIVDQDISSICSDYSWFLIEEYGGY